jgi:hypothetical protein
MVVMLTSLIVIFSAWVVDLAMQSSSREQSQHSARLACLAALEAHFQASGTLSARVDAALARSRAVMRTAVRLSDADFTNPVHQAQLRRIDVVGAGAVLSPGQFFYDLDRQGVSGPLASPVNRCLSGQVPPCFVPIDPAGTDPVSAYRLEGPLYSGVTSKIAGAFGFSGTAPSVFATCAVVPRRLAFVVDASNSMVRETFLRSTQAEQSVDPYMYGRANEFAYFPPAENSSGRFNPPADDVWAWLNGSGSASRAIASSAPDNPPQPAVSTPEYQTIHYRDDYARILTLSDASYAAAPDYFSGHHHPSPTESTGSGTFSVPASRWYYLDKFQGVGYQGPQPLTTVFHGINRAIAAFRQRAVGGDQAAIVFYDNELIWPRVVKPNSDWDYMDRLTKFRDDPSPVADDAPTANGASITAGVVDGSELGMLLAFRHSLFPARNVDGEIAETNTMMALNAALLMLKNSASSANPSQDGIVLFGDALWNCDPAKSPACQNTYDYYSSATAKLLALVKNQLIGKHVPVHVVMVGQNVAPHTLLVATDPTVSGTTTNCLTDAEARRSNRGFVAGGGHSGTTTSTINMSGYNPIVRFNGQSANAPFFEANAAAYEIAKLTQGIWAPLRPPKALAGGVCPPVTCSATARRELEDPLCRTYEEQISSYMDQIIGQNPYIIVEAE